MAYCGVFGFFFVYALRVNLSVGIVCMVKDNKTSSANSTADEKCMSNADVNETKHMGEFDWDKSQTSLLLSSFFYGYITTQVIGGWLSGRFGGRRVLGIGVGITAFCNLLVPVAARWDFRAMLALRIIMGISEGAAFPSMHSLWGRWAPPLERTRLSSFTYAGQNLGNIVTYILSGWLCVHGFDGGWPSIFYVTGGGCLIWVVIWFIVVSDSPEQHPTISKAEKDYIIGTRGKLDSQKNFKVPWLSVLKTRATWVCLTAHVCNNWMHYTLLTGLPTFMKESLKFDIDQNGLLSAIPYMVMVCTSISAGQLADFLRKKYLTTTITRRLFQSISFLGGGSCIVGVGFIGCEHRNFAVALLAVAVGFEGLCYAGYMVNHVDYAPNVCRYSITTNSVFFSVLLRHNLQRSKLFIETHIGTFVKLLDNLFYVYFLLFLLKTYKDEFIDDSLFVMLTHKIIGRNKLMKSNDGRKFIPSKENTNK
ncbi:hypothetical protein Btru_063441 [Bulinus truncatus]|nr:hypothetical protein Btru_063441 [Bulinus truncatus]